MLVKYYFKIKYIKGTDNIRANIFSKYYGPSVINITVTKGGYSRGSRLYKISKTIE